MSRLDYHVSAVRSKMTLGILLGAMAWGLIGFGAVVLVAIVIDRLFQLHLPRQMIWMWSGLGLTVAGAIAYAVWRQPSRHDAAVAIDERLSLKEKFSTALYVRPSTDPFAQAAVKDAETTAEKVSLQDKFPLPLPFHGVYTFVTAVAVVIVGLFLPKMDLFKVEQRRQVAQQQRLEEARVRETLRDVLAKIDAAPPKVAEDEAVKAAKLDVLREFNKSKLSDPIKAKATAQRALQEMNAVREKVKNAGQFAEAQNDMKVFKSMPSSTDPSTPVGKAQDQLKKGEFTEAINNLQDAVKKFDALDKAEQQKLAQQMKNLAMQMQQQAQNPQAQQQMKQALQQLGANQQQAQQMANLMNQAANGDQRAQQQAQQMAKQMMQQLNNGQGANPQQQQQLNNMLNQLQQQANGQAQAQAMAQAAQQLAQAMQAQAGQGQQNQQQGNANQQGNQGANQQQQAQAGGQQPGNKQAMQQALQQMQQMNQAAQAQAAGQQGQNQGQGGANGNLGQGGQMAQGQGQGGQGQGPPNNNGGPQQGGQGGQGGFAIADGGLRPKGVQAPFSVTQELSPTEVNEEGKILASSFVKAGIEKGEAKADLSEAVEREFSESTDEVDQDRIPAKVKESVKDYFDAVKQGPQE